MVQLDYIVPDKEVILSSIGFTKVDDLQWAGIDNTDLIIYDGSSQCIEYYCDDIRPEDLLQVILDNDLDVVDVQDLYNITWDLYDSVSDMLSEVFGI